MTKQRTYVDTETRNDKEKLERVRSGHFCLLFISPELLGDYLI